MVTVAPASAAAAGHPYDTGQPAGADQHHFQVRRHVTDRDQGGLRLVRGGPSDQHIAAPTGSGQVEGAVRTAAAAAQLPARGVDQGEHRAGNRRLPRPAATDIATHGYAAVGRAGRVRVQRLGRHRDRRHRERRLSVLG